MAETVSVTSHALESTFKIVKVAPFVCVIGRSVAELGVFLLTFGLAPWQLDL